MRRLIPALVLATLLPVPSAAVTTESLGTLTPEDLAQLLVGVGVQVSNVSFTGAQTAAGTFSAGTGDGLEIEQGILLSTGDIHSASGPNEVEFTSTDHQGAGDPDLERIVDSAETHDAVVLEFDFVPVSGQLDFEYIFASEEYNEFVGTPFNDAFAFLLDGENIALVPGTSDPVAINNIHLHQNPGLFVNNSPADLGLPTPLGTGFDGLTVQLTAFAAVTPFETHHIKLVIADNSDGLYDSAVFIAQGTFSSEGESQVSPSGGSPTVVNDLAGNRLVVWRESHEVDGIFARLFDEAGFPRGAAFRVDPPGSNGLSRPAAAFDPSGNFVISWRSTVGGGPGVASGVFARPFRASGQASSPPIRVDDGAGEPSEPSVSTDAQGDFVVTWKKEPIGGLAATTENSGIFGRWFTPGGNAKTGEFPIGNEAGGNIEPPRVASTPSGGMVTVWRRGGPGPGVASQNGEDPGIFGSWIDPGGGSTGETFPIDGGTDPQPSDPDVSTDGRGNFVAVWRSGEAGNRRVRGRRFRRGGQPTGSAFDLDDQAGGDQGPPAVSANGLGDFAVTFRAAGGITGRHFRDAGPATGTPFEVAEETVGSTLGDPRVSLDNQGEVTVVYARSGESPGVFSRIAQPLGGTGKCNRSSTTMCLNEGRFSVTVDWKDFLGHSGFGQAVALTDDTGTFWFFKNTNFELLVKVLDGTPINGQFWVFYGALSNVDYSVTVTDTELGNQVTYQNPSGSFASVGDTAALPGSPSGPASTRRVQAPVGGYGAFRVAPWPAAIADQSAGTCLPTEQLLCLRDGRFGLEVSWSDFTGSNGFGTAVPLTSETGNFWFFDENNLELMVKVLDGRSINGHFWVFYGALSNVAYEIEVTDTVTGQSKSYLNPLGTFGSVGDNNALPGE